MDIKKANNLMVYSSLIILFVIGLIISPAKTLAWSIIDAVAIVFVCAYFYFMGYTNGSIDTLSDFSKYNRKNNEEK